jgi:hypothetical protein
MPHPADIAFNDQADAAEAELSRILDRTTPALLGDQARDEEPAPWLVAKLDQFVTGVESGTVQLCQHLANATSPRPAFGVLGLGRLHCMQCLSAIRPEDGTDYPCDHCGQSAELAAPAIFNFGTVALLILECDPCASHTA